MRINNLAIAVAAAILFSGLLVPASSAQDGPMVITPQPQGEAPYGAQPNMLPTPPNASPQGGYSQGGAYPQGGGSYPQGGGNYPQGGASYPQGGAAPETYQPSGGYASEKLPDSGGGTFSMDEIKGAGHRFFGKVSVGFAKVVEYAFQRSGRPNGYILGEEAGGAFVAGLRYGEGVLYTKDAGEHRVFWQGPSVGYDFGAEGSKTMVLVYNLHNPAEIYNRFAGIDGSAYFIGGVGITYMARNDLVLAPIRSGVGLRLGANLGYLKYTRQPTWNPF